MSINLKYCESIEKLFEKTSLDESDGEPLRKKKKSQKKKCDSNDLEALIRVNDLLSSDYNTYSSKWSFINLLNYLNRDNEPSFRWLTLSIISNFTRLTPKEREKLISLYLTKQEIDECCNKLYKIDLKDKIIQTNFMNNSSFKSQNNDVDSPTLNITTNYESLINITTNSNIDNSSLVLVNSTNENLCKIGLSVITDKSIYVEGSLGCGKTLLIETCAKLTNNKLVKYQMDDYMDSKALIGGYICSDIPGEFLYKPGPLYQAAYYGYWLLLEDIDFATIDSISLLIDVLETNCVRTNEIGVKLHSNFRLFLTQRAHLNNTNKSALCNYLNSLIKLSRYIRLVEFSDEEIVEIICKKYKNLNTISLKLLEIYKSLNYNDIECDLNTRSYLTKEAKSLTLRDLIKVCNRLENVKTCNEKSKLLSILSDVDDCFTSFLSNQLIRCKLTTNIGVKFNINKQEVETLITSYKAIFEIKEKFIKCGRVKLTRDTNEKPLSKIESQNSDDVFIYTRIALNLLEKIARCIECDEPVLLAGETGVGKTTALQHLAKLLGKSINVVNLSQQTESSDLLGTFKPVNFKLQLKDLKEKFESLFQSTFSINENQTFLTNINKCYSESKWKYMVRLMMHATDSAIKKLESESFRLADKSDKLDEWHCFESHTKKIEENIEQIQNKFVFKFFEGALTQAIINGEWIILDEINLASSETLQFLSNLLEEHCSSIILYEKGDNKPIKRHEKFRLFAAMNPATDIGKRNLPTSLRSRFTEIFVDELHDKADLNLMINGYLRQLSPSSQVVNSISDFYIELKEKFISQLRNGTNLMPTFSLRTLCRALKYASKNPCGNTLMSVYDAICLSFLTDLNRQSTILLEEFIRKMILGNNKKVNVNSMQRLKPNEVMFKGQNFVNIENYWIFQGDKDDNKEIKSAAGSDSFIFTKTVKDNLQRLARVCSARLPCLIQGDTSIGKTSLIKWLANSTGNRLIRINNHEHTDLQEYIGSYVLDDDGKLVFKEGLLVQAMRKGYWILLDELNLASSEVLEALNRVLDDNRELFIPELQETVKAHPRFILFATQNPPGKYAGRKQLSRAFRNRFIELHFDELPLPELREIVERKCKIPNTYSTLLIETIGELQKHRSKSGIFAGKNSLITLRDLFRWANRYSKLDKKVECGDWKQYLAEQGFIILSGRCRSDEDIATIHKCIESVFKKKIEINNLNDPVSFCKPIMNTLQEIQSIVESKVTNFVWTPKSRRLALLTGMAYKFSEPFLLVGETGCGKTTICQILATMNEKDLSIVNCHMHSEAADFLGSIRPVRESEAHKTKDSNDGKNVKLFEWQDGPLIIAIKDGQDFLIDEISLADDSVLERLNSLLEEERTILVSENSSLDRIDVLHAHTNFRICATMNPSGDFGKKELSPALRNRFLEIWCPTNYNIDEYKLIMDKLITSSIENNVKQMLISVISRFLEWLPTQAFFRHNVISLRDLNLWCSFLNKTTDKGSYNMNPYISVIHGACLVFIDALSSETNELYIRNNHDIRKVCMDYLFDQVFEITNENVGNLYNQTSNVLYMDEYHLKCGPFTASRLISDDGDRNRDMVLSNYCFDSPTTSSNVMRIMRCLLMDNPIMLEGSPGVGKTSLVQSLADLTNNKAIRINLSDQTDLSELFGADLPVADSTGQSQHFQWHDGPFLLALKQGDWIILDEINLASQSVLEGLNSCFDHRGEVFISELGRKFQVNKTKTKIFACQNPYKQGGGRKGLPKSFLNRFSKVYIDKMTEGDLLLITKKLYGKIDDHILRKQILFNETLNNQVCIERKWGLEGSPWEFNLRDVFRWCDLILKEQSDKFDPGAYVHLIYASRFRKTKDKNHVYDLFKSIFGYDAYRQENTGNCVSFTNTHIQIGQSMFEFLNDENLNDNKKFQPNQYQFTHSNLKYLEAILKCIQMNWMTIVVGKACVGKTSLIRLLSNICSRSLVEISVNNSTDASDLLGSYSKAHIKRDTEQFFNELRFYYNQRIKAHLDDKKKFQNCLKCLLEINSLKSEFESLNDKSFIENQISFESIEKIFESIGKYLSDSDDKSDGEMQSLKTRLVASYAVLSTKLKRHLKDAKFEWIESNLVESMKNGDWVLIDNANFCNPSVLDRLNPLLEPNGYLTITEIGSLNGELVKVKPHKNFRLFLCMNETFGEISRPMRNRGIEIYVSEIEPFSTDANILIKSVFTQEQQDSSEFSIDYLNDIFIRFDNYLKTISADTNKYIEPLNYKSILKLAKLIRDYWLIKTKTFNHSIVAAITELYPEHREFTNSIDFTGDQNANKEAPCYFTDTYKITKFPIYKYLTKFPLFFKFKEVISSSSFKNANLLTLTHQTNYIQLFVQTMTFNSINLINSFLFEKDQLSKSNELNRIYGLFKTFFLSNDIATIQALLSQTTYLDISNESFDINTNMQLNEFVHRLNDTNANKLHATASKLSVLLAVLLAKYRHQSTNAELNSILRMSETNYFQQMINNSNNNTENPVKFESIYSLEEFFNLFYNNLVSYVEQQTNQTYNYQNSFNLRMFIHNIERFYLQCTSSYDYLLKISYLKFYWKLVTNSLTSINDSLLPNCWSNNFKNLVETINRDLYFNNECYDIYCKLWNDCKNRLAENDCIVVDKATSVKCKKINEHLIKLTSFERDSNFGKLCNFMSFYQSYEDLFLNINKQFSSFESINSITDLLEAHSQTCFNENYKNPSNELIKTLYIKYQNYPLQQFRDCVCLLKCIFSNNSDNYQIASFTSSNFCELVSKHTHLGQFYSLFVRLMSPISAIFKKFISFFMEIEKTGWDDEYNEPFKTSIITEISSKINYLHFDWLTEYVCSSLCTSTEEQHTFSQLSLSVFDNKVQQLNSLVNFLWSNYSLLSSNSMLQHNFDENLVKHINNQVESLIADVFKSSNKALFFEYLCNKGFDKYLIECLNSETSSANVTHKLVAFGCLLTYAYSPMDPIDPYKYECLIEKDKNENVEIVENELNLYREMNKIKCGNELIDHPFYQVHESYLKEVKSNEQQKAIKAIYRENETNYFQIKSEIASGLQQFCNYEKLNNLMNIFNKTEAKLIDIQYYQTWIISLENLIKKLMEKYYAYSDIIQVPVSGLSLIGYAMSSLYTKWLIKCQNSSNQLKTVSNLVKDLFNYPYQSYYDASKCFINYCCNAGLTCLDFVVDKVDLKSYLYYISLLHIYNSIESNENCKLNDKLNLLIEISSHFSKNYQRELELLREKNEVSEYKYKTYGQSETTNEIEEKELQQMFPSFVNDYKEFHFSIDTKPENEKDKNEEATNTTVSLNALYEQIFELVEKIAEKLFKNSNKSLFESKDDDNGSKITDNCGNFIYLKTFFTSYKLASRLLQHNSMHLELDERNPYVSHILFASLIKKFDENFDITKENTKLFKQTYDIYKDSNKSEVLKCKTIVQSLRQKLLDLMIEWPENSILNELLKLCSRIESFNLNESLIKYLMGLELVMEKAQNWETISSKQYSLDEQLKQISNVIIEWRKLEISHWRQILEIEIENLKYKCSYIWYFHIFSVCSQLTSNNESSINNQEEVFNTFKEFMESSTIGEYETRLKILKICFTIFHKSSNAVNDNLLNVLWNIYKYYSSFKHLVFDDISKNRQEIEKELKDFVNICQWRDINYWALKQSTEKSHKTLYKLIKKFRTYLSQDVLCLIQKIKNEIKFEAITRDDLQLVNVSSEVNISNDDEKNKNYYKKMKQFSLKIVKKRNKMALDELLDEFSQATNNRFANLKESSNNIHNDLGKKDKDQEKYKKDAKNIQVQQRKFLIDLFKELSFIGLSQRKGNINYKESNRINHLLSLKPTFLNDMSFWKKCENEYYSCVKRYLVYKSSSASDRVQVDLKTSQFESMNGYIEHLTHIVYSQKEILHRFETDRNEFNGYFKIINYISKSKKMSKQLSKVLNNLNLLLYDSSNNIQQVETLFDSLLRSDASASQDPDSCSSKIGQHFESFRDALKSLRSEVNVSEKEFSHSSVKEFDDIDEFEDVKLFMDKSFEENLSKLTEKLENIFVPNLIELENKNTDYYEFERIFSELKEKVHKINKKLKKTEFEQVKSKKFDVIEHSEFEIIVTKILKSVENLYKIYVSTKKPDENGEQSEFNFPVKCFSNEFYTNFKENLKLLNLTDINSALKSTIVKVLTNKVNLDQVKIELNLILAFSELYNCLVSNWTSYAAKLHLKSCECLNVLLVVFTEIKEKGFCSPQELENDNGEGQMESKNFENAGLGEGVGEKNVSDQIETEDQLEDAKQKDQEEEKTEDDQQNENQKEDEDGIEMTDDFDANLEDKEPEERNEEDNEKEEDENEENEIDDQLGDVDQDNDMLDNRLWDDEEQNQEENEQDKNEADENNGGEKIKDEENLMAKTEELPFEDKYDPNGEKPKDEGDEEEENENEEEQEVDNEIQSLNSDEEKDEERPDEKNEETNKKAEDENQNEIEEDAENNEKNDVEKMEEIEEPDEDSNMEDDTAPVNDIEKNENDTEVQDKIDIDNKLENVNDGSKNKDIINEMMKNNGENEDIVNEVLNKMESKYNKMSLKKDTTEGDKQNEGENEEENNNRSTNDERTLGDPDQCDQNEDEKVNPVCEDDEEMANDDQENNKNEKDYMHVKSNEEKFDKQMRDKTNKNEKQKFKKDNEKEVDPKLKEEKEKKEKKNNENEQKSLAKNLMEANKDLLSNTVSEKLKEKKDKEDENEETKMETDENNVIDPTKLESFYESNLSKFADFTQSRQFVEEKLSILRHHNQEVSEPIVTVESLQLWNDYEALTQQLSKELCEQLRLILEPTKCSKLKGDYKTGKRLNMKRVVEYIATEYRKDKIWLRRTKPNKRNYQILLAIDNSSSMNDNHCIQLAYESIATLTNAFNFLQVGQFGLASFGQNVNLLHPFQEHFNSDMGAKIFTQLNFQDKKTKIAELLNFACESFSLNQAHSSNDSGILSKLLIVLSDGRGIFYEGLDLVKKAVQRTIEERIFVVFIILDIPVPGKNFSIFDIKMPMQDKDTKEMRITSYMEHFPFPYYIVLRDINNLPIVMIEALKQWFDLVTKII